MALMMCNSAKCHTTRECKLDPDTNKIICSECGHIIEGASSFFITTMRAQKDFLHKKRGAFEFKCATCKAIRPGMLDKAQSQVLCTMCKSPISVSVYMLNAMRVVQQEQQARNLQVDEQQKHVDCIVDVIQKNELSEKRTDKHDADTQDNCNSSDSKRDL